MDHYSLHFECLVRLFNQIQSFQRLFPTRLKTWSWLITVSYIGRRLMRSLLQEEDKIVMWQKILQIWRQTSESEMMQCYFISSWTLWSLIFRFGSPLHDSKRVIELSAHINFETITWNEIGELLRARRARHYHNIMWISRGLKKNWRCFPLLYSCVAYP